MNCAGLFEGADLGTASHVVVVGDRELVAHEVVVDFEVRETALRRETIAAGGRVPTDMVIYRYEVFDGDITLVWGDSCNAGDTNYGIFAGTIPTFDVANAVLCETPFGGTAKTVEPEPGNTFYLVVPHNEFWQGSFGQNSQGIERPMTGSWCFTQEVTTCE